MRSRAFGSDPGGVPMLELSRQVADLLAAAELLDGEPQREHREEVPYRLVVLVDGHVHRDLVEQNRTTVPTTLRGRASARVGAAAVAVGVVACAMLAAPRR